MIKVFHSIEPTFFAPKEPVVQLSAYHHVADVDSDNTDEAYELTNSIDRGWWQNSATIFHGSPLHGKEGCRSTSVGDIMQLSDGSYVVVASFGFEPIEVV